MGVLLIIAVIFIGAPIARAIARSIERGQPLPGSGSQDQDLRRALQTAEQRLSDSETRLAVLEDRLDFYEKLLASPKSTSTSSSAPVPPSDPS